MLKDLPCINKVTITISVININDLIMHSLALFGFISKWRLLFYYRLSVWCSPFTFAPGTREFTGFHCINKLIPPVMPEGGGRGGVGGPGVSNDWCITVASLP